MDPTGIWRILNEIIYILSSRVPSVHDTITVQEIFNEINQKSECAMDIISTVQNFVHDIVDGLTDGAASEEISHVQHTVPDISDEVHNCTGNNRSINPVEHTCSDITNITSRQPNQ
jgi:hypothetical protein